MKAINQILGIWILMYPSFQKREIIEKGMFLRSNSELKGVVMGDSLSVGYNSLVDKESFVRNEQAFTSHKLIFKNPPNQKENKVLICGLLSIK